MFSLLVFFFKLFFTTFFSILFSYFIIEEEENNLGVILFGILGVSLSSIVMRFSVPDLNISISILIFSVLYLSYNFFNISYQDKTLLFIFPGIIGLMVGLGLIFEAILILAFLYIAKNSLDYIYEAKVEDDNIQENEENNK